LGDYVAFVVLSGQLDEHKAVGDTRALALTGATALALWQREQMTAS
jgi:hypothetical protein